MANGKTAEGRGLESPEVRALFTRDSVLTSDWYGARLDANQRAEEARLDRAVGDLDAFIARADNAEAVSRLGLIERRDQVIADRALSSSDAYRAALVGSIGRQVLEATHGLSR